MAKGKSARDIEELMEKRYNKKKEEMAKEAKKELDQKLSNICYTVLQDPNKKGRNFLLARIKFDVNSMRALVDDYVQLNERVIGLKYPVDQENLKYYFDKAKKKGEKSE